MKSVGLQGADQLYFPWRFNGSPGRAYARTGYF